MFLHHMRVLIALLGYFFLLSGVNLFNSGVAIAANPYQPSIIYSGRLLGDDGSIRLILESEGKFIDKIQYLAGPTRIVVEFENSKLSFAEPELLKARGLITDLRYGSAGIGKSRLILNLKQSAKILAREVQARENDRFQLIYDIATITNQEFLALHTKNAKPPAQSSEKNDTKNDGKLPLVVIDPGHGGVDGGAQGGNGIVEKFVTLAFAKRLKTALERTGKIQVKLTREDDRFLSLKKRVAFVRNNNANLFLSIHADSLRQKNVRGATLYTLSKKASDNLAKNLADAENRADLVGGNVIDTDIDTAVVEILAELAMRETKLFARRFARNTVKMLRPNIKLIKNPHRFASFGVLKAPNTPSILLELGYLSNKEDAKLLQSDAWQSNFSNILARAIQIYLDKHS